MSVDALWLLSCGFLVVLMQAGFTCLESGLVRSKNSINVAIKNLVDFCISVTLFALIGYGLMFGTSLGGWVGMDGFWIGDMSPDAMSFFFFQAVFCGTATTIVSGAVAERMRFVTYAFTALLLSGLIYPIAGHWVWAMDAEQQRVGWLAQAGFMDFAGSTVVHSVAGWVALAALIVVGPRLGRFGRRARHIEGHSLPIATLGVFLLWFGWFGFNAGSTYAFSDEVPRIVVNTAIAGAVGGLVAMGWSWWLQGRPAADAVMNGVLAGLVAITASCNLVSPVQAVVIAAVGATLAGACALAMLRLRLDDAIGAVPVHLAAGIWGTLAIALFAPVSALATGDRLSQAGVQLGGILAIGLFAFSIGLAGLLLYRMFQPLRVSQRDELIGLNIAEHGASTSLLDLLSQMDVQAHSGDFSKPVNVENESEASQVAAFYNAVLEKFNLEIDRRKMALHRLQELAHRDPLTGLANRRLLLESIRHALSRGGKPCGALLYLDLDSFKQVNDRIGHDAGDAMLKETSRRLQEAVGTLGMAGRLGGDEFAVLLECDADAERVATGLARSLIHSLSQPFDYGEHRLQVGVSVGIALIGETVAETVKGLVRNADEAMYQAKMAGKGTYRIHGRSEGDETLLPA